MTAEVTTELARTAAAEEIETLLHDAREEILLALLENSALQEVHIEKLLERLDLSANVLGAVGEKKQWAASESVRLRLAQHPRTPKRIALAVVRQIYLFNLVRLTLLPSAPADIRRVAEEIIVSRVPQLPVGQKLTLARRGPSRVAGALLAEGHGQAMKLALENAFLTESQVLKVLSAVSVPERVVVAIAQHPKWSREYNVRIALIRSPHAPVEIVRAFLPELKVSDLDDLSNLTDLAPRMRDCVKQELERRSIRASK
jgi:hypothetical protein